jgi:predicted nucleotidyltransferase
LYGSRANDRFKDHSDFALAIAFKNFNLSMIDRYLRPNELAMDWSVELGIKEELMSIVDINQAPIYLAFNIVEYGFPIYLDDSTRALKEQSRIYSQYEFQMKENTKNA